MYNNRRYNFTPPVFAAASRGRRGDLAPISALGFGGADASGSLARRAQRPEGCEPPRYWGRTGCTPVEPYPEASREARSRTKIRSRGRSAPTPVQPGHGRGSIERSDERSVEPRMRDARTTGKAALEPWDILGVDVQVWERRRAVEWLDAEFGANRPTCVAFANTNLLNLAATKPGLRSILKTFTVFNDGVGTDIAAFVLYGRSFPCNMNGTDFVPFYLENTAHAHRIFLVGARPDVARRAAQVLQDRFKPRHEIVGWADGFSDAGDREELLRRIAASGAGLLLVGMGNPKQEVWLADAMAESGCKLAFGVGALLDFTAGAIPRAPLILRRLRLEWAHRLGHEPRRLFKRYVLETPVFLARVLRQRLSRRPSPAFVDGVRPEPGGVRPSRGVTPAGISSRSLLTEELD